MLAIEGRREVLLKRKLIWEMVDGELVDEVRTLEESLGMNFEQLLVTLLKRFVETENEGLERKSLESKDE